MKQVGDQITLKVACAVGYKVEDPSAIRALEIPKGNVGTITDLVIDHSRGVVKYTADFDGLSISLPGIKIPPLELLALQMADDKRQDLDPN